MKTHFLVSQPPIVDKYVFLVDNISNKHNWGRTTDIDKIEYNRKLLGDAFNIDLKLKLLFAEEGETIVMPIGRFITIVQIRSDEREGVMTFFDFEIDTSKEELQKLLLDVFSEKIVKAWYECFDQMHMDFRKAEDIVILHKPDNYCFA